MLVTEGFFPSSVGDGLRAQGLHRDPCGRLGFGSHRTVATPVCCLGREGGTVVAEAKESGPQKRGDAI